MKKVVITVAGLVFLLILSSGTGKLLSNPCQEGQPQTKVSLKELTDNPRTIICNLSDTFVHENGRCLVIWLEFRTRHQKGDCLNLQIDLYLYDTLIREERTITRRINYP